MSRSSPEAPRKESWARPGSRHDVIVRIAKLLLPLLAVAAFAWLALVPFLRDDESSFILDKEGVATSEERMRVEKARYRGEDDQGREFLIVADEAVQETSQVPVVVINGLAATLQTDEGPVTVVAPRGRYDIDAQLVTVPGLIRVSGGGGYRLDTSDVTVDLATNMVRSDGPVSGATRLGRFSGTGLTADLDARTVVIDGRANLQIVQGAVR